MEYVDVYAMMGIIRSEVIEAKFLHTIPCFKITISLKERSDSGLTRGPIGPRSWKPDIDHAPGCSVTYGYPANQSPFVQIHLPKGWKYEKKSSRAVSYCPDSGPIMARGTNRKQDQAFEMACAWSWRWFGQLAPKDKPLFQSAEPTSKKRITA